MKKILLTIILFPLFCTAVFAYRWPLEASSGPHPINATLGEFRSTHLHAGVDTNPSTGAQIGDNATKIYAIEGCDSAVVSASGTADEYVTCGRFKYQHVHAKVNSKDKISANQVIAELKDLGTTYKVHLHLEESSGVANPLRNGGLDNYTDSDRTYVYTLDFYRDPFLLLGYKQHAK